MSLNYWEQLYQDGDTHWDHGGPSPGLVDFLAAHLELPRGTVSVPGCGAGHDVRAFAQAGFDASGFDIAPSAIALAEKMTADKFASGAPISESARRSRTLVRAESEFGAPVPPRFHPADFLRDDPPQLFDWIFEHTLFCAIRPEERGDYVHAVRRWLKPGGQYLAVNYMIVDDGEGPPFATTRDELWRLFSPHFKLVGDWMPRSYPNRTGRERMFWWRRTDSERNTVEKRQRGG